MRRAALAILVAAASPALGQEAPRKALLREANPVVSLLERSDLDRDGVVTRAELDLAGAAARDAAEGEFATEWSRKLEVYGLPRDSEALDIRLVYRETVRMFSEADADHDGALSPREIKDYAMGRDHALRADTVTALLAFDRNGDMTVSEAEAKASGDAFRAEVAVAEKLPRAERDAVLAPSRASRLESWKSTTDKVRETSELLWSGSAKDGRADVEALREKGSTDAD